MTTPAGSDPTAVAGGRDGARRLALAALALVVATFLLLVAVPWTWHHYLTRDGAHDIHDLASLPGSLHPCARTYAGSRRTDPRTLDQVRTFLGEEPLLVDPLPLTSCLTGLSAPCAAGSCTPTVVWVRVGEDAYVSYSLRGGP